MPRESAPSINSTACWVDPRPGFDMAVTGTNSTRCGNPATLSIGCCYRVLMAPIVVCVHVCVHVYNFVEKKSANVHSRLISFSYFKLVNCAVYFHYNYVGILPITCGISNTSGAQATLKTQYIVDISTKIYILQSHCQI
jgi:hypothetical protein